MTTLKIAKSFSLPLESITQIIEERFYSKIMIMPNGCWLWTGKISTSGYGRLFVGEGRKRVVQAHRWIYEHINGEISNDLDVDHLCRNRWCVNPEHLEPVTRRENLLRGNTIVASHAIKTHCPSGHPYDGKNTYYYKGLRYCKICRNIHRERSRLKYAKKASLSRPYRLPRQKHGYGQPDTFSGEINGSNQ
jgi:hypothetical protein